MDWSTMPLEVGTIPLVQLLQRPPSEIQNQTQNQTQLR